MAPPQLERQVVYGTVAYWLGKKAEEDKSHKWTCYLRANRADEDLGLFIRKVVFQLHPSFDQATRGALSPHVTPVGAKRSPEFPRLLVMGPRPLQWWRSPHSR